jgi:hypothetical protein
MKQVQRPATDVVVMPVPSVAVNVVAKHCEALIPDEPPHCQIKFLSPGGRACLLNRLTTGVLKYEWPMS